jgi:hypothetical protein
MKHLMFAIVLALGLIHHRGAFAQEKKAEPGNLAPAQNAAAPNSKSPPASQEELEAKFKAMLTKATLSGRWSPIENGKVGPEKGGDNYSIVGANKIEGDRWVVNARMKYGQNEMVIPVPVQVKWSGDTAVIIVNDLSMGGNRSYTARVLFYDDTYAGTWTANGGNGGLLYGTISRESDSAPKPQVPKPEEKK